MSEITYQEKLIITIVKRGMFAVLLTTGHNV